MSAIELKFLSFLVLILEIISLANANYLTDNYPATVLEDAKLDTAQLLFKHKYPVETHFVTTEDNYILQLHRIPNPEGQPVLLMHGLIDSSAAWILMGPWSGLGYYLHDKGYDVWLGNARGNRYSRNHTTYKPDVDKSFWQFSWHEIGYYDLPAMIDYVLKTNGAAKLGYFGHSQGTTAFWVMCAMRNEYNDKVTIMQALAPVAFLKHVETPSLGLFRNMLLLSKDTPAEFLPHTYVFLDTCFQSEFIVDTCLDNLWQIMGKDPQQLNATMLPVLYGHLPAGGSLKQFRHYLQLTSSDRFCQFDYGPMENMKLYGRLLPADYELKAVTVPVALYYASNDNLATVKDVQRLAATLPNVVESHLYPHENWNHISMLWGVDARALAHKHMLEMLEKHT